MRNKYLNIFLGYAVMLFLTESVLLIYLKHINILEVFASDFLIITVLLVTIINIAQFPKHILNFKPQTKKEWIIFILKNVFFQFHSFFIINKQILNWLKKQKENFKNFITYWQNLPDE